MIRQLLLTFLFGVSLVTQAGDVRYERIQALSETLTETTNSETRAELLLERGHLFRETNQFEAAESDALAARDWAKTNEAAPVTGQSYHLLGTIYAEQNELSQAVEYFMQARDTLARTDAHLAHARAVLAIAVAYIMAEDFEGSLVFLRETESLVEQHDLTPLRLALHNNLGIVRQELEGDEASLPDYQEALALAREQNNRTEIARLQALLCSPLAELGRLKEAQAACDEAYELLTGSAPARIQAGVRVNLASLATRRNELGTAESLLQEALELTEGQTPTARRDALRVLVEVQEKQEDYQAALATHRKLSELREDILAEEQRHAAERESLQRQIERSQQALEVVNLERELAATNLERQRWILVVLGLAFVVLIFLATWGRHFYRAKIKHGEDLAAHDPLTGLLNRRGFESYLSTLAPQGQESEFIQVVLLADLDQFKEINDQYGHQVGDDVLRLVAERLQRGVRDCDAVIRWGGEEFLIFLPEVAQPEHLDIAERLRAAISAYPINTRAGSLNIQITLGVAEVHTSITAAITRADDALRRGKESGRNQVMEAR